MVAYFKALDTECGFYKWRWGDAPVRSLQSALSLAPSQILLFEDVSYIHEGVCDCKCANEECERRCRPDKVLGLGLDGFAFSRKPVNHQCSFLERKLRGFGKRELCTSVAGLALLALVLHAVRLWHTMPCARRRHPRGTTE
mmetsp:Transcript_38949/g.90274  ORF Transcript_38949/g.90274 Transcript_38949/m.90274 type:complete len:141 (-) Transcript_38949:102-524(-)